MVVHLHLWWLERQNNVEVNVCIPVLKRYDTLVGCIESACNSTVMPDNIYVINNGINDITVKEIPVPIHIYIPGFNIGVAASWNYFIKTAKEMRIICNDDVQFFPDTIELLIENFHKYGDKFLIFPGNGIPSLNSFSCYVLSDKIIEDVGLFDETISPNYAYFEDNDYSYRMSLKGYNLHGAPEVRMSHVGSATLKVFNSVERDLHNKKFGLAQSNYVSKWGGPPNKERWTVPYNGTK